MRRTSWILSTLTVSAIAVTASLGGYALSPAAYGQAAPPAPARYDMDVGTATGVGMGAGNFNPLSMLSGRGASNVRKELYLRLGSPTAPTGGARPQADHFMPEAARLGRSVPLATPERQPRDEEGIPGQGERPRGRILIYWGCGAHAAAGQPVIIDLSRLAAGQMPPGLYSTSVPRDRSVTFANSRTYGDWPNSRSRTQVSEQSSVAGAHRIAGNYAPEISYTLTQDYMPALTAAGAAQADQSTQLSWNAVAGATGYYAWTMGMRPDASGNSGDMVWWSSSASQQFGGGLWDWLSPGTVSSLIRQRVVMPPTQTNCTVPAEVKQAAPDFMFGNLYAYGPEANFAYPPRPANTRLPWHPIWTARVRYRSNTSWMIGGPGMADAGEAQNGQATPPARCRRRGGLAGALGGALGVPGC